MIKDIVIRSYIPSKKPDIAIKVNMAHKKVLNSLHLNYPSNNNEWIRKKNVIGFFAQEVKTKQILCAYRHEFIFSNYEVLNTPFLKGVNTSLYSNLMHRLYGLIEQGPYSETCAFWCSPYMKYKKSNLSRNLFTYGILSSFLNGTKNVLGLAPIKLIDYYTSYGLALDNKVMEIINYSDQLRPSQFVIFNNNKSNIKMQEEILGAMETGKPLKLAPYEDTYLHIEKPELIFSDKNLNKNNILHL